MDRRHEEIARCLFRESNDALFIFDPRDHRVLDVNPAALRLTGLDKDVACALTLSDLFAGDDPEGLHRLTDAYRRTGFFHSREGYSLRRAAGEPLPVNLSASRIHTTPDPLGLVVARDVSERVRADRLVRQSEERYRNLVETAKVLIWSLSLRGEVLSLNRVFEEITGWSRGAWVGQPVAGLIHPDDLPAVEAALAHAGGPGGAAGMPREVRVRAAAGGYVVVEVLSASCQAVDGVPAASGVARDVTAVRRADEADRRAEAMRRAKEAAESADRSRREFLGQVSHELRTPMTAVLGYTDLLLADDRVRSLPDDLLAHLHAVRQGGAHLLDLINDLLDLTRAEAGKLRIEPSACSPAEVAAGVAAAFRGRAEAQGLSLTVEVDPTAPAAVLTDPVRLRQVLINLVSNALKFTREGEVTVRVGRGEPAPAFPAGSLRVEVADTGVGLSESEVRRLFEPFYTSESPTTRESGAGLGLAITRTLAGALGGEVSVRSRPGEGSTFTLTLPATPAPPEPAAVTPAETPAATPPPDPLGGRLLLAEDNEPVRRYLALRLSQAGVEVEPARHGLDAVEKFAEASAAGRPFDWVLMDVQMPQVDGLEATRQIRQLGFQGPVIALTAYATADDLDRCLQAGCDDHVPKPVDWDHLLQVLRTHRLGAPA